MRRRIELIFAQCTNGNQFLHRRWLNQALVVIAQELSERRTGKADYLRCCVASEIVDNLQQFFALQVGFINDQQVDIVRELTANQRIRTGNLDQSCGVV